MTCLGFVQRGVIFSLFQQIKSFRLEVFVSRHILFVRAAGNHGDDSARMSWFAD